MKRDMELVRAILLAMERHPHGFVPEAFTVAGYDQEVIRHHIWLMGQGGLVTANRLTAFEDASPTAIPPSITWNGHEWLDLIRNETVWMTLKTTLKDRALSLPFDLLKELALQIGRELAGLS